MHTVWILGSRKCTPNTLEQLVNCELKAPYERWGKKTTLCKAQMQAGESLGAISVYQNYTLYLPVSSKGDCFSGNQNSATSVHFYTVSSPESMCFSLACGSKNFIEIQLQSWSSAFSFVTGLFTAEWSSLVTFSS